MLDERKLTILNAIINSYYDSSEPVGSRTLSREYELGVSSATIRNEMSDLEALGFLNKAHSSSGRIPSDKAYRHYVDSLLSDLYSYPAPIENRAGWDFDEFSKNIRKAQKILFASTGLLSLALFKSTSDVDLKNIGIVEADEHTLVFVTIEGDGKISNFPLKLRYRVSSFDIEMIENLILEKIRSKKIYQLPGVLKALELENIKYKAIADELFRIFSDRVRSLEQYSLNYEGLTSIFDFPDFEDAKRVRKLMDTVLDEDLVIKALGDDEEKLRVVIGKENELSEFSSLAMISSFIPLSAVNSAKLVVIGPKNMNYRDIIKQILSIRRLIVNRGVKK